MKNLRYQLKQIKKGLFYFQYLLLLNNSAFTKENRDSFQLTFKYVVLDKIHLINSI